MTEAVRSQKWRLWHVSMWRQWWVAVTAVAAAFTRCQPASSRLWWCWCTAMLRAAFASLSFVCGPGGIRLSSCHTPVSVSRCFCFHHRPQLPHTASAYRHVQLFKALGDLIRLWLTYLILHSGCVTLTHVFLLCVLHVWCCVVARYFWLSPPYLLTALWYTFKSSVSSAAKRFLDDFTGVFFFVFYHSQLYVLNLVHVNTMLSRL